MDIYTSEANIIFFSAPYNAKRLLDDSIQRAARGGLNNHLLARIESAAAFCLTTLSASLLAMGSAIMTPCFLIPAVALNLLSRFPGISSFKSVREFTDRSSDAIYRTLRIHVIAILVISLFLIASVTNTFVPLKQDNHLSNTLQRLVNPLGPLQTIRAIVPNVGDVVGTQSRLSALGGAEEYVRALSNKNYLSDVQVDSIVHHYTFSR